MADDSRPEQAELGIQARIRASFERQGLMRHLGARLGHVAPGRVHIVLPNRREVNRQHGYIHAGATSAIADSAGGYAAFTLFPENTRFSRWSTRSISWHQPSAITSRRWEQSSSPDEPSPCAK